MTTQTNTKIETATANETVNTVFQVMTIAMVGIFTLAQTVSFLAAAV
jgi:hypothetical protein